MATTKLLIRKNRLNKDGRTKIYIRYTHYDDSFLLSTKELIDPIHWNAKSQEVRKTYGYGYKKLNDRLHDKIKEIDQLRRIEEEKGNDPTFDHIRSILLETKKPPKEENKKKAKSFFRLWDEYIENKRPQVSPTTIKHFVTSRNHLKNFAKSKRVRIKLDTIDINFYEKYINYLFSDLGLTNNTVGTEIKQLKTFLHYLTRRRINTKLDFQTFKKPQAPTQIIVLTRKEMGRVMDLRFPKGSRLERIKDLFLVGLHTGLRYSDLSKIRLENVSNDNLVINPQKTDDEPLRIPITNLVRSILIKYDWVLPKISNQKFNDALKEIGNLAELNDQIVIRKISGGNKTEEVKSKWELLSSHCARRTFITQSLERGMRPEVIMQITGHKKLSVFQKYIKITQNIKELEMKRAWDEEIMRVG